MQSSLPDINSQYLMLMRQILSALPMKKWSTIMGCLNSINALLPDDPVDYRVTLSTIQYNNKVHMNMFSICNNCKAQIDFQTIKVFDLICPLLEGLISQKKTEKVWICPECKQDNKLSSTLMTQEKPMEPRFIKVVPNPPLRKDGLADRRSYDRRMEQWVWACLNELTNQMGKFRREYVPKDGEGFDDSEIDTSIEDSSN